MKQAVQLSLGFIIGFLLSNVAGAAITLDNPPSAVAPPCRVGLQHTFAYKNNRTFTRTVSKQVGELCVVGNFFYDKDWVLVKQIAEDGREITSPDIQFPLIGEKWLQFPLFVGKEWQHRLRSRPQGVAGVRSYVEWFNVVSAERITVRAGTFETYKIKYEQRTGNGGGVAYLWYSPDVEYYVKVQYAPDESTPTNFWLEPADYELISFRRPGDKTVVPNPAAQVVQDPMSQQQSKSMGNTLRVDKPEWKLGHQWRYAWKTPGTSGTLTREVVREDSFAGVPSYVVQVGKNESFYTKDGLGLLATMTGGVVTLKRDVPFQPLSWPLEVGKEWKNSLTLERLKEKSSQTYDNRVVVSKIESVQVPAGTYEAFKIEVYAAYSGNLLNEYWYSAQVKWFVRSRTYNQDGVREEELLSYKVD